MIKRHPKGVAPRGVTTLGGKSMGYADGGVVKRNTFRSESEKAVDAIYAPKEDNPATKRLNDKIDKAEGGIRG